MDINIRTFDLGGSGLKTCIVSYKNGNFDVSENDRILLKYCPENERPAQWLRKKLPSLDDEINSGWRFGFSMAGLEKLWEKREIPKIETLSLHELFGIPSSQVYETTDGRAHLFASLDYFKTLEHPVINIAIGTGIGFACTDIGGKIINDETLRKAFKKEPYELKVACDYDIKDQAIWYSLSTKGFLHVRNLFPESEALNAYRTTFKRFVDEVLLPLYKTNSWYTPKTLVLTGGIADWQGDKLLFECNVPNLRIGPKDAGILGAAVFVKNSVQNI